MTTKREKELTKLVRDRMSVAIGETYYKLEEIADSLPEDELEYLLSEIQRLGTMACKAIRKEYIAY